MPYTPRVTPSLLSMLAACDFESPDHLALPTDPLTELWLKISDTTGAWSLGNTAANSIAITEAQRAFLATCTAWWDGSAVVGGVAYAVTRDGVGGIDVSDLPGPPPPPPPP